MRSGYLRGHLEPHFKGVEYKLYALPVFERIYNQKVECLCGSQNPK